MTEVSIAEAIVYFAFCIVLKGEDGQFQTVAHRSALFLGGPLREGKVAEWRTIGPSIGTFFTIS